MYSTYRFTTIHVSILLWTGNISDVLTTSFGLVQGRLLARTDLNPRRIEEYRNVNFSKHDSLDKEDVVVQQYLQM